MGVVIERVEWEPGPLAYLFLFCCCFSSIFFLPYFSKSCSGVPAASARSSHSSLLDLGTSAPFLRFQRRFLLIYSLASVIGGLETVFGEDEYQRNGASRAQMVLCLCAGAAASLFIGSFLGVLSDVFGPRKSCTIYCIIHLFLGALRSVNPHPNVWMTSVCLALASFIFVFSFETWMVTEHDKEGHRQDLMTDTFWLMIFFESVSLVGSQVLANVLIKNLDKGFFFPSVPAALLAMISILYIRKEWNEHQHFSSFKDYWNSFSENILSDKRIWLLACAQACIHFSMSIFWILWAPTIVMTLAIGVIMYVIHKDKNGETCWSNRPELRHLLPITWADGREVHLSLIYPCFLGSRMLGSTMVPWFSGPGSFLRNEDYLTAAFVVAGLCLTIVAYDYQEVGVLVSLFCIFHACGGLIFPSLARLRTIYVPNELRASMISLSLVPANAAILLFFLQGGYYRNLSNAVIIAFAAFGLFIAAGCIYILKRWRKHPRENWHKL